MIDAPLITEMQSLTATIAPELAAAPPYILPQPIELPAPDVNAYAIGEPCPALQEVLTTAGQWRGPAPAIVFVADLQREHALSIYVHELAHLLPRKILPDVEPSEEARAASLTVLDTFAADPTRHVEGLPRWAPDHGRRFHRIAIHLWWRAAIFANLNLPAHPILGGMEYDLSSAWYYIDALGDEPLKMRCASFAEIENTPRPPRFESLWRSDYLHWRMEHPKLKEAA